jgi:hypothetical protein
MTSAPRSPDYPRFPRGVFASKGEVVAWLSLMVVAAIVVGLTVFSIHSARAEESPKPVWVIVATVHHKLDKDKHFPAFYSRPDAPGTPAFFDSEAECKKMLEDKKGDFLTRVWPKFKKVVVEHDAVVDAPRCDLLEPIVKGDSV